MNFVVLSMTTLEFNMDTENKYLKIVQDELRKVEFNSVTDYYVDSSDYIILRLDDKAKFNTGLKCSEIDDVELFVGNLQL